MRWTVTLLLLLFTCVMAKDIEFHAEFDSACLYVDDFREIAHNDALQKAVTTEWVKTHKIDHWNNSESSVVSPREFEHISKQYPLPSSAKHSWYRMTTTFDSYVKLPRVLQAIINKKMYIHSKKESFVLGSREYKWVHVSNVPLVSTIDISSKSVLLRNGKLMVKFKVSHGKIPWYAAWSQGNVENEIKKSTLDFYRVLARNMCK